MTRKLSLAEQMIVERTGMMPEIYLAEQVKLGVSNRAIAKCVRLTHSTIGRLLRGYAIERQKAA